jgi:hypothetical protein
MNLLFLLAVRHVKGHSQGSIHFKNIKKPLDVIARIQ